MNEKRVVNEEIISFFETYYSRIGKPLVLMYEAPTGYGKTTIAPYHGYYAYRNNISYGYIHVLPMRSMVYKLYQDYTSVKKKLLDQLYGEKLVDEQGICYQASGLSVFGKNPFLSCLLNFTTFDSYFLNLIRMGIGERNLLTRHHETSRAMIFTSTITFDEAHLYGGDPGSPETVMFSNFKLSLQTVLYARAPVNVLSATLPSVLSNELFEFIKLHTDSLRMCFLRIKYGELAVITPSNCNPFNRDILFRDKDYDSKLDSLKWRTNLYEVNSEDRSIEEVVRDAMNKYHSGLRILIVVNKPERAVKIYEKMKQIGSDPVLIHGRLKYGEREKREKELGETDILVATQVVEAGIDVDYDILYTDIAPPSNLIQRAGRVNRYLENREGEINIIIDKNAYENIYSSEFVGETIRFLKNNIDKINWRRPRCTGNCKGYVDFLDEVYINTGLKHRETPTSLEYILLTQLSTVSRKSILGAFLRACSDKLGVTRSSLLIPLIHVENTTNTTDLSWRQLYENTVPASLTWILNNADKLFEHEVEVVFITSKLGETDEYRIQKVRRENLEKKICSFLIGETGIERRRSSGEELLFIGLLVKQNAYRNGLGLLV